MESSKLIKLSAGLFVALALIGTVYFVGDNAYYCVDEDAVGECFKLSKVNSAGTQTRCYYNESTPTKYNSCKTGWIKFSEDLLKEYISVLDSDEDRAKIGYNYKKLVLNSNLRREDGKASELNSFVGNNMKFGSEDLLALNDSTYIYTFESNLPIEKDEDGYYVFMKMVNNKVKELVRIDVNDICEGNFNFNPECSYTLYSNNTAYYLNVKFIAEFNKTLGKLMIDPEYEISNLEIFSGVYVVNSTAHPNATTMLTADFFDNELIAYWNFDGDLENVKLVDAYDSTGVYRGDYLYNAVSNSTNCTGYGNCLHLDGGSSEVNTTLDFTGYNNFTVSTWVFPHSLGNYKTIWSNDDVAAGCTGEALFFAGNDDLFFRVANDADSYAIGTGLLNNWTHIVATQNDTHKSIYFNAQLNKTFPVSGTTNGDNTFEIGDYNSCASGVHFDGLIDEVMVFNKSLNLTDIETLYNNQTSRYIPNSYVTTSQTNITIGNNTANASFEGYERLFNTNISMKFGEWNLSAGYNDSDLGSNDNLISAWHFDFDFNDTVIGNNGTANGGANINATYGGFPFSNVSDYDGSNSYVYVDDSASLETIVTTNSYTASFWINPREVTANTNLEDFIVWMDFLIIRLQSSSRMELGHFQENSTYKWILTNAGTVSTNDWQHFAVTYNDTVGGLTLYKNGANFSTTVGIKPGAGVGDLAGSTNLYIGGDGNDEWYNGSIDDLHIWNRSLSHNEVKEMYTKGRAKWDFSTEWQNITDGDNQASFTISNKTTNLLPEFQLFTDSNSFYSPVFKADSGITLNLTTFVDEDLVNPNATLLLPENGTTQTNQTFNFTVNATDNVELENATIFIYNESDLYNTTTYVIPGSASVFHVGIGVYLKYGIYDWFYVVADVAGNFNTTDNRTITIVNSCNYTSGNWNISEYCVFVDTNITVDGNVTWKPNAILNLTDSDLFLNSTEQWFIFENMTGGTEDKLYMNGTCRIEKI